MVIRVHERKEKKDVVKSLTFWQKRIHRMISSLVVSHLTQEDQQVLVDSLIN